jgi:acetyltransferase
VGDAQEKDYDQALDILEKRPEVKSIITILTPQAVTPVEKIAQKIVLHPKKPKVAVFMGGQRIQKALKILNQHHLLTFNFPETAVELWKYFSQKKPASPMIKAYTPKKVNRLTLNPTYSQALQLIKDFGIDTVPSTTAQKEVDLLSIINEYGFPLVAKADLPSIVHKSNHKAIILEIKTETQLITACHQLLSLSPKVVVSPQILNGIEIMMGITKNLLGVSVLFGAGGRLAEQINDHSLRFSPLSEFDLECLILETKIGQALSDKIGMVRLTNQLKPIIKALLGIITTYPQVKTIDINPIKIYLEDRRPIALDARIEF